MRKCAKSEIGEMLHAYELKQLPEDKVELFELHLLDCERCFEEVREFEAVADIMTADAEVRETIGNFPVERAAGNQAWRRILDSLWPRTSFILKPAFAYFVVLLLAYPAYIGLLGGRNDGIRQVQTLNLVPNRASSISIQKTGADVLLSFVFQGTEPGRINRIEKRYDGGKIIFGDDDYRGFDKYEVGRLILPANSLEKADYTLTIVDPNREPPLNRQVYNFSVK